MAWAQMLVVILTALEPYLGPLLEQWLRKRLERKVAEMGEVPDDAGAFRTQLEWLISPTGLRVRREHRLAKAVEEIVLANADTFHAAAKWYKTIARVEILVNKPQVDAVKAAAGVAE